MKVLLIIADGLGDRPSSDLGGKTPLESAVKPNIDYLAKNGITGLIDPISPGIIPGSDTSHLTYLGYDAYKYYTGRGPFEALGSGLNLEPGDIAFRANFATVDDRGIVKDRRAGRIRSGTDMLAKSLNMKIEDVEILFKEGIEHRAALVLRGEGLSPEVSDNDPHQENVAVPNVVPLSKKGEKTARILNEFYRKSRDLLNEHEINKERRQKSLPEGNAILFRGGGIVPELQNFEVKHGIKGGFIAAVSLVSGICRLAGMKNFTPPGVTGSTDTNVVAKLRAAVEGLKEVDFILVNIKGTDIAGHDGNAIKKKEFIEKIDKAIGDVLMSEKDNIVIAFTGDHSTPASLKEHSSDSVPIFVYYKGSRRDGIENFNEMSARGGTLRLRGNDLMNLLLSSANVAEKFGA